MKLSAEIGTVTEAVSRFMPHHQIEPPSRHPELEGITGELDYPQESIMQLGREYSLFESVRMKTQSVIRHAEEFVDNHPVITGVGLTTAFIAAEVLLDKLARPETPQTEPLSV